MIKSLKNRFARILVGSIALSFLGSCGEKEKIQDPGRALLEETIKAHGGKENWYGNGLLKFRWTYHMTDRNKIVDSVQTFDPQSMSVVHTVPESEVSFGMTQGEAWISPPDGSFGVPARFWALTPSYFLGIPFVFNDENASFEILPDTISFEDQDYQQLKVTFSSEAGDSPDDYYVLLIDPETKLTRAAYYTVTHTLVVKDAPGPPKLITLDELQELKGVKLASAHRTFKMKDGVIGAQMRKTDVSDLTFVPRDSVDFSIPVGAKKL